MAFRFIRLLIVVSALIGLPAIASAQDATLTGTVKDTTGGVLPGVTITATHTATGNTFVAVTDTAGAFRLLVRTGAYRITVELSGFAPLVRTADLLLNQTAVVNLEMAPSTLQETVTVTGEAPLIDTASSTVAGNIDPRQMQELPLNGRNWMDLAMLAPGSRQNASGGIPLARQGYSQVNLDGQQVTVNYIGLGDDQAKFSRDSIAEFELITNRFDATQGRSAGMVANAITKSGTNVVSGSVSGYFRDEKFNAADKVQNKVLPYSDKQLGVTFGGPIKKDRIHYFANYEKENEPQVLVFSATGALAAFNMDVPAPRTQYTWGVKVDTQFTSNTRLSVRGNGYDQLRYTGGGATAHPSTAQSNDRFTKQVFGTLTTVLSNSTVNVLKSGFSSFDFNNDSVVTWKGGPHPDSFLRNGAPVRVSFRGYTVGGIVQHHEQNLTSVRDDLTMSFEKSGRHAVKLGGEYIYNLANLISCGGLCTPRIIAQNGAPTSINLQAAFPVWNDAATWNYNLVAPLSQRYETTLTNVKGFDRDMPQHNFGTWLQDDWTVSPKLTLNLGVRYDIQTGLGTELNMPPFLPGEHPTDINDIAPRFGFAYSMTDRTVLRGGYGRFYTQGTADEAHQAILFIIGVSPTIPYDGRADWPTNPFNGPAQTFDQVMANACDRNGMRAGCLARQFIPEMSTPFLESAYAHQASIGLQRQIGTSMSVESNVVYTGGRGEEYSENINLTYNPATGANYPASDVTKRSMPQFGTVELAVFEGRSNYYGWENSFTKRMSNGFQASLTYTLSKFSDSEGTPYQWSIVDGHLSRKHVDFPLAPDIGPDYTLAATDQRHRAVFNGIWEGPGGLQLSGVYFYGSGQRYSTSYGGDLRDQVSGAESRLRPNGTVVTRNNLIGKANHRVDMRLQKRFALVGRASVDGMIELFNVFNYANFGSYTTQENSASYGLPAFNSNISYGPRMMQLGFRFQF